MTIIKIRYNTEQKDGKLIWRVLRFANGVRLPELAVDKVNIMTHSFTTMDEVAPGVNKAHITTLAIKSVLYSQSADPQKPMTPENELKCFDIYGKESN